MLAHVKVCWCWLVLLVAADVGRCLPGVCKCQCCCWLCCWHCVGVCVGLGVGVGTCVCVVVGAGEGLCVFSDMLQKFCLHCICSAYENI